MKLRAYPEENLFFFFCVSFSSLPDRTRVICLLSTEDKPPKLAFIVRSRK